MKRILFLLLICLPISGYSQDRIFGKWITVDDDTGKERSVVEIFEKNGKAYGRIFELLNPDIPNPICTKCTDDRKDQPIKGLEIIRALKVDNGKWSNGTILDPEKGKIYNCKIWVDGGKLKVRGFIAFFFRTQEWVRVPSIK